MLLHNVDQLFRGLRTHPDVPFWQDCLKGAVLGDFADHLGLPGAVTQIAVSLVPVVGELAIVRDIIADTSRRDNVDIALNVVALTPFLGGFAKSAEVLRNARRAGQSLHILRGQEDSIDGDGVGRAR